jgi:ribose transport system ATP-binding protein
MGELDKRLDREVLRVTGLSKSYTSTQALNAVDFTVRSGEIHALIGGNGSGKSTLIKILAGVETGDAGTIQIGARTFDSGHYSSDQAHACGLRVVHQNLGVFPEMSVAENIALGYGFPTGFLRRIRWRRQRIRSAELLERFGVSISPRAPLGRLSKSDQTQVAIARALQGIEADQEGLLILDEPTASLPDHESKSLLDRLRRYAESGEAIVYVSHRLDEILSVADRVTVLRDGNVVGTFPVGELDEPRLVELIVGSRLAEESLATPSVAGGATVLEVRGLAAGPLRDVDLRISAGEIVGVAGLLGSGRSELLRAIFGDLARFDGTMEVDSTAFAPRHPSDAMSVGLGYVPEDREAAAAFMDQSVSTNISVTRLSSYWRRLRFDDRARRRDATRAMDTFFVKAGGARDPLRTLSGGNQQKVILGRWLQGEPKLLLLDEPTQGVDVGARADIYGLVRAAVTKGMSALVVASDFEELAQVCDRVVVIRDGRIVAEVAGAEMNADRLVELTYASTGTGIHP